MPDDDFQIEPVNMAQTMSVMATVLVATVNTFLREEDTPEEKTGRSWAALTVFLHQLLMATKHPNKAIGVLKAIIVELEERDAKPR